MPSTPPPVTRQRLPVLCTPAPAPVDCVSNEARHHGGTSLTSHAETATAHGFMERDIPRALHVSYGAPHAPWDRR